MGVASRSMNVSFIDLRIFQHKTFQLRPKSLFGSHRKRKKAPCPLLTSSSKRCVNRDNHCLIQFISRFALIVSTFVFKPLWTRSKTRLAWIYQITNINSSLRERKSRRKRPVRAAAVVRRHSSAFEGTLRSVTSTWLHRLMEGGGALLKNSSCHINFAIFALENKQNATWAAPASQVRVREEHGDGDGEKSRKVDLKLQEEGVDRVRVCRGSCRLYPWEKNWVMCLRSLFQFQPHVAYVREKRPLLQFYSDCKILIIFNVMEAFVSISQGCS